MELEKEFLNYEKAKEKEWLIANGLGGYASSTIINLNTRKYHGLLVAAIPERFLLLSKLEEEIAIGDKIYKLSCNKYSDIIHPQGFEFLEKFKLNYFPEFIYNVSGIIIKVPEGEALSLREMIIQTSSHGIKPKVDEKMIEEEIACWEIWVVLTCLRDYTGKF